LENAARYARCTAGDTQQARENLIRHARPPCAPDLRDWGSHLAGLSRSPGWHEAAA
jgi:hypothetical protein